MRTKAARRQALHKLEQKSTADLWREFDRLVPAKDYPWLNPSAHSSPSGWYADARTPLYQNEFYSKYLRALAICNIIAKRQGGKPDYDVLDQEQGEY